MKLRWLLPPTAALLLDSATPPPSPQLDYSAFAEASAGCGQVMPESCGVLAGGEEKPAPAPEPAAKLPDPAAGPERSAAQPPGQIQRPRWRTRYGARGRLRVVVSIPQQRAYVFDGASLVATSRVSTGRRGHETPVGTFRILEKAVAHRSNRYANAPMPYMQRLTSYGIALHAGHLPGYPASHGCIRLPWGFARKLYDLTDSATTVTVTNRRPRIAEDALWLA
jgi:lipoprotein-anchoring transpeptidase ErfK/SrfK